MNASKSGRIRRFFFNERDEGRLGWVSWFSVGCFGTGGTFLFQQNWIPGGILIVIGLLLEGLILVFDESIPPGKKLRSIGERVGGRWRTQRTSSEEDHSS